MKRRRKQRRIAALAVLLAAAVAIPFGVQQLTAEAPDRAPATQRKQTTSVDTAEAARQARRTGKDVEATAERTANSTTWVKPDGLLRTRTYSDTVRAKVGGEWKEIDTDLQRVKGGYAPKAVNDPLLFSAGTGQERSSRGVARTALTAQGSSDSWSELVRLNTGGHEVVLSWPGPLPAPVVDGPRALYENVRPGIDLLLTARDSGFSHLLIVHSLQAAADPLLGKLKYLLDSPGLTFRLDKNSHALSAVDSKGEEFASAPTPYAWDSAGAVKATVGEAPAEPTASPVAGSPAALALAGLAGPQPGSHDAVLSAALAEDTLTLGMSNKLLTDPDTVYPVFIDPSLKGRKKNWTLLYQKYASSSFYNGQNFNDGTNEARVGYENDSGGLSRSVFTFEYPSDAHGASVKSAYFRTLQTYSWGCASRQYNVWLTGAISSSSTWSKQPAWSRVLGSQTNGHGYKSGSCPDKWVATDIKSGAQEASTKKLATLTLGLRAASESDTAAWKKFMANGEYSPYIEITYNRPPDEPTSSVMKTSPGGTCDTAAPYLSIGKSDVTFSASASDVDGNLKYLHLKVWRTGNSADPLHDADHATNSSGAMTAYRMPAAGFTHGTVYSWSVYAKDTEGAISAWGPSGTAAYCQFTVDHSAPNSPGVSSTDFPEPGEDGGTWSSVRFGTAGRFTFSPAGSADVKEYQYSFNTAYNLKAYPDASKGGTATTGAVKPPHAGPSVLYVRAVDSSGNVSVPTNYLFNVTPGTDLDSPGDVTGDKVPDVYTIDPDGKLMLFAKALGTDPLHLGGTPAAYTTETGKAAPVPDGYWTGALITHNGDWLPGDGIQDLVARMPDGKLYLYPGDGYGSFDVHARIHILLPSGSPAPSAFRQILSVGDMTADGRPDLLATTSNGLWAFTGYTGASFETSSQLTGEDWTQRDIVQLGNIAGDEALDLVYRDNAAGQLHLRQGKKAASGGTDPASIATKAAAAAQLDTYGVSGWSRTSLPIVTGTPDVSGDGVPDIWALLSSGDVRVYPGRAAGLTSTTMFHVVSGTVGPNWAGHTAIG
ncbi:DNRLRE domain-containing protein [Streptomyces sp. A3M-1-3]|uniref:DNRLRE domain-containing protein n=1 Tax=Streptomyces sp. A3M-1-3 TaxID=2962044 RepID=UPI0020B7C9FD|nr:DNRLRE domain-containing protein [Streptomyces sp. A3M-1-3]MCP3822006.1 DNRLRE domain-containing protein [Streptomyces sp. A3M-1-3]